MIIVILIVKREPGRDEKILSDHIQDRMRPWALVRGKKEKKRICGEKSVA